MKTRHKIIIVITFLLAIVAIYAQYLGIFITPVALEKEMGPYTYLSKEYKGPYKNIGKAFDELSKELNNAGIKTNKAIGVYYDNPATTKDTELRSDCGYILDNSELNRLDVLKQKYKINVFLKQRAIVTEFPLRNSISYMLAPIKCYSVLNQYLKKENKTITKSYEIYDTDTGYIYILAIPEQ